MDNLLPAYVEKSEATIDQHCIIDLYIPKLESLSMLCLTILECMLYWGTQ